MLAFLRARHDARQLSRKIRENLEDHRCEWCLAEGGLTHGDFRLEIVPRRLRIFDAVHIYVRSTEVWMPLLQRLFLRAHIRYAVAARALYQWEETHCDECSGDESDCSACDGCCIN